ncbi:hypothetical protein [Leptospira weilii]|nr:hypothetical protein [Leptospira weilii]
MASIPFDFLLKALTLNRTTFFELYELDKVRGGTDFMIVPME